MSFNGFVWDISWGYDGDMIPFHADRMGYDIVPVLIGRSWEERLGHWE